MATVVDCVTGQRFEGVHGPLLDYYRSEAKLGKVTVTEDVESSVVEFPVVYSAPDKPVKSANKDEWIAYAREVDPSLSDEDAEGMTIAELQAHKPAVAVLTAEVADTEDQDEDSAES